jgi:DNA-binding NarL/FixJ family response regulator
VTHAVVTAGQLEAEKPARQDEAFLDSQAVCSVLLVSSFRLVREATRALIERHEEFQVIGEAGDPSHALRVLSNLHPDVILFDLDSDYASGIETIREIIRDRPSVKIVAVSMRCDHAIVEEAVRAGVIGFICKAGPSDSLTDILKTVAQGGAYLSPLIVGQLIDRLKNNELKSTPNPALEGLTEREVQVLRLLAEGLASKEVAAALNLAVETVRSYRKSLMKKLKIHNVAGLVQFAASAGVIVVAELKGSGANTGRGEGGVC